MPHIKNWGSENVDQHVALLTLFALFLTLFLRLTSEETGCSEPQANTSILTNRIQEYVLKEVKLKLDHGQSQHVAHSNFSTSWATKIPNITKLCLGLDHSQLLADNFGQWFLTKDYCGKLHAHWKEKDEWLNKPLNFEHPSQSELRHGQSFRELSYFWDPEVKSLLPEKCLQCQYIVPADVIAQTMNAFQNQIQVNCPHCKANQFVVPRYMRGDARNQAITIHEDGWNPHSTSSFSMPVCLNSTAATPAMQKLFIHPHTAKNVLS